MCMHVSVRSSHCDHTTAQATDAAVDGMLGPATYTPVARHDHCSTNLGRILRLT